MTDKNPCSCTPTKSGSGSGSTSLVNILSHLNPQADILPTNKSGVYTIVIPETVLLGTGLTLPLSLSQKAPTLLSADVYADASCRNSSDPDDPSEPRDIGSAARAYLQSTIKSAWSTAINNATNNENTFYNFKDDLSKYDDKTDLLLVQKILSIVLDFDSDPSDSTDFKVSDDTDLSSLKALNLKIANNITKNSDGIITIEAPSHLLLSDGINLPTGNGPYTLKKFEVKNNKSADASDIGPVGYENVGVADRYSAELKTALKGAQSNAFLGNSTTANLTFDISEAAFDAGVGKTTAQGALVPMGEGGGFGGIIVGIVSIATGGISF